MRIGLAQQILGLADLIGRVHGDEDSAHFYRCPEGDIPLGHVRGPDGDLVAGLHPHVDEGAGKAVHVVPKLSVGTGIVQRRILDAVLVRELLRHAVQHLREGQVDERILFPDVEAVAPLVVIKAALGAGQGLEAAHVPDEMGEYHVRVAQLLIPEGVPFEGDEAGVVDRAQGVEHGGDGQAPLADDRVSRPPVLNDRVLEMHVLHIGAQVRDRRLRALVKQAVGMLHVPEGGQVVLGEALQHLPQPEGVGVEAAGLQQQRDPLFLRQG